MMIAPRTRNYVTAKRYGNGQWKISFCVALLLHLLFVVASIYAPDIFKTKPQFAEVHTVSLIELETEQEALPPVSGGKEKKQDSLAPKRNQKTEKLESSRKKIKRETQEKTPATEITESEVVRKNDIAHESESFIEDQAQKLIKPKEKIQPAVESESKAISLAPRKKKILHHLEKEIEQSEKSIRKKQDEKIAQEKAKQEKKRAEVDRKKRIAKRKAEERARRKREAKLLAEQAALTREKQRLAQQALEAEKALLRSAASTSRMANRNKKNGSGARASAKSENASGSSVIADQYFATIRNHLLSYWALPVNLQNKALEATVVVTVNKEGRIVDMFFEKRSGERVFDQFVEKTVQAANPLAPIPLAMRKERIEFGFKFSPRGIQPKI